ncbi:Uncharacterized conserved protein [Loktanella fryxellensis]|uniref:Uncharacterized conserved protein n=1 Tax=Loktanella fryxellensis TaxID=245187 RepID=A0A1H8AG65_9RHOB|nr:GFA family protein [Loktanella fryxellensis]SEM68828.1 Uncharacterized conserved protein [Loktanella fryxellensis]
MSVHRGSCHCGAVTFTVTLTDGLATARRCTCSLCARRGAVAVSAQLDGLRLLTGAEVLRTYRFNTGAAAHHFCSTCGIYTHHTRQSNPHQIGVNLACLDGQSPFLSAVLDGQNHPTDTGQVRTVGTLHFIPAEDTP